MESPDEFWGRVVDECARDEALRRDLIDALAMAQSLVDEQTITLHRLKEDDLRRRLSRMRWVARKPRPVGAVASRDCPACGGTGTADQETGRRCGGCGGSESLS